MSHDAGEQDRDDATATTGGGATADRGHRDAGAPGPDPKGEAGGPQTGSSPREVPGDAKKGADRDPGGKG